MKPVEHPFHRRMAPGLATALLAAAAFTLPAQAADPVRGATLYRQSCAECHGNSPLTSNVDKIYFGRNSASTIDGSIGSVGDMKSLRSAFPSGGAAIADVAAYLGNTPASLGFPTTDVGASSVARSVTVYASLKAGRSIANLVIGTTGDFRRSGGTCGTTVNTGTSCTVLVEFRPAAGGSRNGTLSIAHSQLPTPALIALNGSGAATAAPAASVSPASLALATTPVGVTSAAKTTTLTNTGNARLTLGTISSSSSQFIVAGGTCVAGGSLAAGAACTVAMKFAPTAAGARTGTLKIAHNAAGSLSKVTLGGTATPPVPLASLSKTSVAFGIQVLNSASAAQSVKLSNTGSAALQVGTITVKPSPFKLAGGTCVANTSLAAGTSCTVKLKFRPTSTGSKTGTLTVAHNAAGSPGTVALTGTGVIVAAAAEPVAALGTRSRAPSFDAAAGPVIAIDHATLDFTAPEQTLTVHNRGSDALRFSGFDVVGTAAADYTLSGTCAGIDVLAAGDRCALVVRFVPGAAGDRSATLNIGSDAINGPAAVSLNGLGERSSASALAISPDLLDFGRQALGGAGAERRVTLSNHGSRALSLSGLRALAPFAAHNDCPTSLAAGASCTLRVVFQPARAGDAAGQLEIRASDGTAPQRLALSGAGVAGLPSMAWMKPAGEGVDFGTVGAGEQAPASTLWLRNRGPGAATLERFKLHGDDADAFSLQSGGSCVAGARLASGASCSLVIGFSPAAAGPRSATLEVQGSGSRLAPVVLTGRGSADAAPSLRVTPAALSLSAHQPQVVSLHNEGSAVLQVQRVAIGSGRFSVAPADRDGCNGDTFALMPGQRCDVQVSVSGAVQADDGSTDTGTLEIDTETSPTSVKVALSADRAADRAAELPAAAPNFEGGGCSIARGDTAADPVLWLLVVGAAGVLWQRRRRA